MQYNSVVKEQPPTKSQNTLKQDTLNPFTSSPPPNNTKQPPINNIFSRNVISNPMNNNHASPSQPPSLTNVFSNIALPANNNIFNAGTAPGSNNVASQPNPFLGGSTAPNQANRAPASTTNMFGGSTAQSNIFSNTSTQNSQNTVNIFNKNSNTSNNASLANSQVSFPNTQNQKQFTPTFTNAINPLNSQYPIQSQNSFPGQNNAQSKQTPNTWGQHLNNVTTTVNNPFNNPISAINNTQQSQSFPQNQAFLNPFLKNSMPQ
jgi:hypothetical protein